MSFWDCLTGMKIVAIKCYKGRRLPGFKYMMWYDYPDYIFFDDGETFIQFRQQDDEYHDANPSARTFNITKNKTAYDRALELPNLIDYVSNDGKEKK